MTAFASFLSALRRTRDEAQFTRAVAAAASSDEEFASRMVCCLLAKAPRDAAVERLGSVPSRLVCQPEQGVRDSEGGSVGRVDLRFTNDEEAFTLLVEIKLHSEYGESQLDRYRSALDPLRGRSALLAVTTNLPGYGEESLEEDEQWLGSVRWSQVFSDLRSLDHGDSEVAGAWKTLLDLMRTQGDFGVMDVDEDAIQGWAQWKRGRAQLRALLEQIHEPTLDLLVRRLQEGPGGARVEPILHNEKRLVWPWGESIHIEYAMPPAMGERFRIQFIGGREVLLFDVAARFPDDYAKTRFPEALADPTEYLEERGFEYGSYWGSYWARIHRTSEWLGDGVEGLMRLVSEDVEDLVSSGIFDELRRLQPDSESPSRDDQDPEESVD